MAKTITIFAILFTIAACDNGGLSNTAKSAAAGAAVGAGANYIADEDPLQGAAIGAVGGAVIEEFIKN